MLAYTQTMFENAFTTANSIFVAGMIAAPILALYFLPAIIASHRRLANTWSIIILNFFLGWTLLGWVIPLALAAMGTAAKRA